MNHDFQKSLPYSSRRGCPSGYHKRKGYTVRRTGEYVPPRCVKSTTVYAESHKNYTRRMQARSSSRLRGISEKRQGLNKTCPKGYLLRRPYVRQYQSTTRRLGFSVKRGNRTYRVYPKQKSTLVKAACIKDRGLPGSKSSFGSLRRGDLSKYGYNIKIGEEERHRALRQAIGEYGALGVFRKLDAVAKLSKRTAPEAKHVFEKDRDWVRDHYSLEAF